jgi:very-short-patch-repair endonuclease
MNSNDLSRQRAQNLRKSMTKEESHLWYDFLKGYPVQFKRQYTIGVYIVDFYCYRAKLIVELDGSQHCEPEAIAYDQQRTAYLQQQGYYVLRISNRDVMTQFRPVCEAIDLAVQNRMNG